MATASPTPMPTGPVRRTSQRQALRRPPSRQALNRGGSQAAPAPAQEGQSNQYHDDSSEDEIPVPMKLSAITKALLNEGGGAERAARPASPPRTRRQANAMNASAEGRRHLRSGSVQAHDQSGSQAGSPPKSREPSPVRKRVVRLSNNTPQTLNQLPPSKRLSTSTSRSAQRSRPASRQENRADSARPESRERSTEQPSGLEAQADVNTPAQAGRVVRIVSSSGKRSRMGSSGPSSGRSFDRSAAEKSGLEMEYDEGPDTVARNAPPVSIGSISRYPSTSTRSRPDENGNLQSSMRVKRVGKLPGSFLSGPARRGRRRQSEEEDGEGVGEGEALPEGQEPGSEAPRDRHASSFYADGAHDFNSGSPAARAIHRKNASSIDIRPGSARPSPRHVEPEEEPEQVEVIPRRPAHRPEIPSTHDQENEVPSSYKRTKPSVDQILEKIPTGPETADIAVARMASPQRKPLAAIAQNTPHRAAPPPPPKMSVLEAATSSAGAATTTQAKQRRNVLRVNGKCYTRLDCLGRGGSAKVYRVTAENGKMFALKRVSLEHADEAAVRGFRGEIDLLGKLSSVDRVITLFDYEMNEEKKVLTLLMEMGELDLNTLMRSRQNPEAAKFDAVFVRMYWKEMLECIQSVHQHGIVHADLKPANFVLVLGRLKLIDFGIADAIQTDETVNVHRETQQGTPNYMSPESLMDANPRGGRMAGRPRLTKIGKPSDVWSLGCILYQMVYGVLPFGHIANQMAKCQAIINWNHPIEYPSRAVGGVPVPPSLLRTMKRCLNRDQHMRPTCEELLHDSDPFLYPSELSEKALPMDEELLGRIIQSVVTRCRERMPTEAEGATVWPQAYWASVKKAMAARS